MRKVLFFLFVALLISQYYCEDELLKEGDDPGDCPKDDVSKAKDCKDRNVGNGYHKCCFWDYETVYPDDPDENEKGKDCYPVTKVQYEKIKDYIDLQKKAAKAEGASKTELSIDCGSNYIIISIISFISLLII